jgi:hypothetical protein
MKRKSIHEPKAKLMSVAEVRDDSQQIASVLEEARQHRVQELFEAADHLAGLDQPPLTDAEVEAEIEAARSQQRASREI